MHMPLTEHALGLGYLKLGKTAEAVSLLQRAAEQRPKDAAIREHLALTRAGRTRE
jgi:Flp pilus assembly protein TadD